MTILEILKRGGPINWVLAGLSLISLIIVLERILYFIQTGRGKKKGGKSQTEQLLKVCNETKNLPESYRRETIEKKQDALIEEMEKGLWLLSFISSCAPSLGLLGTVTGLIKAFQGMAQWGTQVNIQNLSAGIWEAMLTTACGLIVAVPALFFCRFFKRIIDKRSFLMTQAAPREIRYPDPESGEKDKEDKVSYARF